VRAAVLTLGTKSEEGAMCSCARISQRCRAESGRVEGVILLALACRPPVRVVYGITIGNLDAIHHTP
jgi:hypothetical protein